MSPTPPLPQISAENAPFYEAAARGELRLQKCASCGRFRHYPRPICPHCLSREFRWERASGNGEVYTWTIARGPTLPAFEDKLPYNIVDVLLDEGVHFVSQILDCAPEDIHAGIRVRAVFVEVGDVALVKFVRIDSR